MKAWPLIAVVFASAASAEPPPRVLADGARHDAGMAVSASNDAVGITAWMDKTELNRTASLEWIYAWRGIASESERYRPLFTRPGFDLFFRSFDSLDVITRGGTALGIGAGVGLGVRAGTPSGSFSVTASPLAAIDGFWVVRDGESGFSGRVPLGVELGMEGKVGRVVPYVLGRAFEDVWPRQEPARRYEVIAGLGMTVDLPKWLQRFYPSPPSP